VMKIGNATSMKLKRRVRSEFTTSPVVFHLKNYMFRQVQTDRKR